MTTARKQQICLEATPYYHCVSRCVRRSFLCGYDEQTRRCYEHRRGWIENRIQQLSSVYCVDICAYAVMSNHYHLVIHINRSKAKNLSVREVISRWSRLHTKPVLIQRYLNNSLKTKAEFDAVDIIVQQWRERLFSLSWFMRELNFHIALKANQEDECKGHFWESRYKCQALLDENALLAAMAYVDLNPVRAGVASTPEESKYTSVKERIDVLKTKKKRATRKLYPFVGDKKTEGIPFRLMDYLELVDWTARQFVPDKVRMSDSQPPIFERLKLNSEIWLDACRCLEQKRAMLVGSTYSLQINLRKFERKRTFGLHLN